MAVVFAFWVCFHVFCTARLTLCTGSSAISIWPLHDASVAVSRNGRIQCVLELERLFEVRYYASQADTYRAHWLEALRLVRDRCDCDDGIPCPLHFDHGVMVKVGAPGFFDRLPAVVEEVFSVGQWHTTTVDHHVAHASLAFHDSSLRSALVLSYDGGGNDGVWNVFYFEKGQAAERVHSQNFPICKAYNYLGRLLPEVTEEPIDELCRRAGNGSRHWRDYRNTGAPHWLRVRPLLWNFRDWLNLKYTSTPGKVMGYAATGKVDPRLRAPLGEFYQNGVWELDLPREVVIAACSGAERQRDLAATFQSEFERAIEALVGQYFRHERFKHSLGGVALTGGCALNVPTNQRVYDMVRHDRPDLGFHVPAAPGDNGLTIGALWALWPPPAPQKLQYLGFRLWDEERLDRAAQERGARRLSVLGGVEYLADLLNLEYSSEDDAGTTARRKPIVALVRGRQEFGPRALGHRSLVAVPDCEDMRDRLNRLKHRRWYRPVAPMIADEALETVFGSNISSPYMSMAPYVTDDVRRKFPALVHLDGTARHQSVGRDDEPWLHALLRAVGRRTGLAALLNTSFNSKGKPIVNTIRASLQMLDELPDLDYLLINDWLFKSPNRRY